MKKVMAKAKKVVQMKWMEQVMFMDLKVEIKHLKNRSISIVSLANCVNASFFSLTLYTRTKYIYHYLLVLNYMFY